MITTSLLDSRTEAIKFSIVAIRGSFCRRNHCQKKSIYSRKTMKPIFCLNAKAIEGINQNHGSYIPLFAPKEVEAVCLYGLVCISINKAGGIIEISKHLC